MVRVKPEIVKGEMSFFSIDIGIGAQLILYAFTKVLWKLLCWGPAYTDNKRYLILNNIMKVSYYYNIMLQDIHVGTYSDNNFY